MSVESKYRLEAVTRIKTTIVPGISAASYEIENLAKELEKDEGGPHERKIILDKIKDLCVKIRIYSDYVR